MDFSFCSVAVGGSRAPDLRQDSKILTVRPSQSYLELVLLWVFGLLEAGGGGRSGILELAVLLLCCCCCCWLTEIAFFGRIGERKLTT